MSWCIILPASVISPSMVQIVWKSLWTLFGTSSFAAALIAGTKARYRLRIANSCYPTCTRRPRHGGGWGGGSPSEYCYAVWHGKTRMMRLPDGEKMLMCFFIVLTQFTNVTDTHRHTAPPSPLLSVPNVTAHPSTASVPTSYYSMWHYKCLWGLKKKESIKKETI